MDTTWAVVQSLGIMVEKPEPGQILVYGSADPMPNPAELLLTYFVAKRYKIKWQFFSYRHGKNLPMTVDGKSVKSPRFFYFEDFIDQSITLGEISQQVFKLRKESTIIAHIPGGISLRATSDPSRKWSGRWHAVTIFQLHQVGGWLGGSGIHYILRLLAERKKWVLYICPFQEKGRVYEIYRGFGRPLFVPTPFVRFIPPARLGLPSWSPTPWNYWLYLPAAFRRLIRKEVMRRLFSGERRIEIPLP